MKRKSRYSPKARAFVGKKVQILLAEGRDQAQAVAIALSMARKKGLKVPRKNAPGDALFGGEVDVLANPSLDDEIRGLEREWRQTGGVVQLKLLAHALARAGLLDTRGDVVEALLVGGVPATLSYEDKLAFVGPVLSALVSGVARSERGPYCRSAGAGNGLYVDTIVDYLTCGRPNRMGGESAAYSLHGAVTSALKKLFTQAGAKRGDVEIRSSTSRTSSSVHLAAKTPNGMSAILQVIAGGWDPGDTAARGFPVGDMIYPHGREERSDLQSDYFAPAGVLIDRQWVQPFARALLEGAGAIKGKAAEKLAKSPAATVGVLKVGAVVRFREPKARRRYVVTRIDHDRGQVDMVAMSGGAAESWPTAVAVDRIGLDPIQHVEFEGKWARKFRQRYEQGLAAERREEDPFGVAVPGYAPPPPPLAGQDDPFGVADPGYAPPPPPLAPRRNPRMRPQVGDGVVLSWRGATFYGTVVPAAKGGGRYETWAQSGPRVKIVSVEGADQSTLPKIVRLTSAWRVVGDPADGVRRNPRRLDVRENAPNKYPGFCVTCNAHVGAGHGTLTKSSGGAWVVKCRGGRAARTSSGGSRAPRRTASRAPAEPRKSGVTVKGEGISVLYRKRTGVSDASGFVGDVFLAGPHAGPLSGQVVTVVGAETSYESDEDNEDMGDMSGGGWGATLYVRQATPEEAAPVLAKQAEKQAAAARAARIQQIVRHVREVGRRTEEEANQFPLPEKGDPDRWDLPHGDVVVLEDAVVGVYHPGSYDDYRPSLAAVQDQALADEVRALHGVQGARNPRRKRRNPYFAPAALQYVAYL